MVPHSELSDDELERLRYPLGRFQAEAELSPDERSGLIEEMAVLPGELRGQVSDLSSAELDVPYRPGGWTVRQVVHHLPDSHMNGYVRMKLAATEKEPTIKLYDQEAWAELSDGRDGELSVSLQLLEALHGRWTAFLRSLEPGAFARPLRHPKHGPINLDFNLQLYAWHGRHHLAQITRLRERMRW